MNAKAHAAVVLAVIAVLCGVAAAQAKPEQIAQQAAESWLVLTDAGRYAESWAQAAEPFKASVTTDQWVAALNTVRRPLGKAISRKLKSATYTKSLPNAPEGEYVVLQFETSFEQKQGTVETVVPMLEKDGKWRVSGYFIK